METKRIKKSIMPLVMALAAMAGFTSCSDEITEAGQMKAYRNDGKSIVVQVSSENPDAVTRTEYNLASWHTDFVSGDEIGVFAYNGSSLITSNVRFTFDGTSWSGDTQVPYNEDYTYYAYYPYQGSNGNPPYTVATSGTVDTRFAAFITDSSNKFHYANQSTAENFAASDYMHAEGVESGVRAIAFTMQHKKALAVMGETVNKWYDTTDPMTPNSVDPVFTGNIPLLSGSYRYFLCKNNVETTIGGTNFTGMAGKYVIKDASVLTGTPSSYTYSTSSDGGATWGSYSSSRPSWLTVTPDVADGKPTDFNVTTTSTSRPSTFIKGYGQIRNVPGDAVLRAAAPVANVDLSMVRNDGTARGSRTTANCYLVHAPGTYRLPLVYGNAIKDGDETSTAAFYTTNTSANVLQRFVNHLDVGITAPWIKDNGITVNGGKLVWEDVRGMVKNVSVDGDYLTFEVDADNIAEGNAVIAATSSGTTVWSWHIWVTSETLSNTTSVAVDGRANPYVVTPVDVGQINGTVKGGSVWAGYQCRVRATGTGGTVEFLVVQPDFIANENQQEASTYENPSPYYMWGKKDPLFSAIGACDADGNLLTYNGSKGTFVNSSTTTIGLTIQNPDIMYVYTNESSPYGPNNGKINFWDMNQLSQNGNVQTPFLTPTDKTVYDPCPPDMCVPTSSLYIYMRQNNTNFTNIGNKLTWIKDTPNIVFYKKGYRQQTELRNGFNFWTAVNYGTNSSVYFGLWNETPTVDYSNRHYGYPVRAVAEE